MGTQKQEKWTCDLCTSSKIRGEKTQGWKRIQVEDYFQDRLFHEKIVCCHCLEKSGKGQDRIKLGGKNVPEKWKSARTVKEITGAAIKPIPAGTPFEVSYIHNEWSVCKGLGIDMIWNDEYELTTENPTK